MQHSDPLISVIIPVYKVEEYLYAAVDSVFAQTYCNIEIILVDDGSPDNSGDMCDELARIDSRVRVIHKKNGGLSSARNAGICAATGEYIAFLDSDDFIDCNMYLDMVNAMQQYHPDVVCSRIMNYYGEGKEVPYDMDASKWFQVVKDQFIPIDQYRLMTLTYRLESASWNKLYRRELFDKVRFKEGRLNEDYLFIYFLGKHLKSVYYLSNYYYRYRYRMTGICRSGNVNGHFEKNVDDIAADLLANQNVPFNVSLLRAFRSFLFDRFLINIFRAYEDCAPKEIKAYYCCQLMKYSDLKAEKTMKSRIYFYVIKYFPCLLSIKAKR